MNYTAVPVRLSYALVAMPVPKFTSDLHSLGIEVTYASGKVNRYRPRFRTPAEAEHYIERFYPDLVGKCTSIEGPTGSQRATSKGGA